MMTGPATAVDSEETQIDAGSTATRISHFNTVLRYNWSKKVGIKYSMALGILKC